jgi:transposase
MVGEDTVTMSAKELRRVHVLRQLREKRITQREAGEMLQLTDRQIRRLLGRVNAEGDQGLVHRGRGKPSNRRVPEKRKKKVLELYEERYGDFGPTLAVEKLAERDGITLSAETLRGWLMAKGVTHFRRRRRPHRAWRARKAHVGELVQLDGSHHDWFEGRGPRCVLMAYIDDASSRVLARFYEYEGTVPAMDSLGRYVKQDGIPLAVYTDKHTTYKSPAQPTVEEQLTGEKPQSQFERSLAELGVELIHAHSPQAKGRIERLFSTFQDRLIKELRLAGIATLSAANRFLETYLPTYNQRFAVRPAQTTDLHRPSLPSRHLDRILCLKTNRVLRRDWTVAHNGHLYQIHDNVRTTHVMVEERLDGTLRLTHHGRALAFHMIAARPVSVAEAEPLSHALRPVTPKPTHPWRKRWRPEHNPDISTVGRRGHF